MLKDERTICNLKEKRRSEFTKDVIPTLHMMVKDGDSRSEEKFNEQMKKLNEISTDEFLSRVDSLIKEYITNETDFVYCEEYFCEAKTKVAIAKDHNRSTTSVVEHIRRGKLVMFHKLMKDEFNNLMFIGKNAYDAIMSERANHIESLRRIQEEKLMFNLSHPDQFAIDKVPQDILPSWLNIRCRQLGFFTLDKFLLSENSDFIRLRGVGEGKIKDIEVIRDKIIDMIGFKISNKIGVVVFNLSEKYSIIRSAYYVKYFISDSELHPDTLININTKENNADELNINHIIGDHQAVKIIQLSTNDNRIDENIYKFMIRNFNKIIILVSDYTTNSEGEMGLSWYLQLKQRLDCSVYKLSNCGQNFEKLNIQIM